MKNNLLFILITITILFLLGKAEDDILLKNQDPHLFSQGVLYGPCNVNFIVITM